MPQDNQDPNRGPNQQESQMGQTRAGEQLTPQAQRQQEQAQTQNQAQSVQNKSTSGAGAQAVDKNKEPLVVGDAVTIKGTIVELNDQNDRHMNITIETSENMFPTDRKSRLSLNSRQVEKG